ncbi:transposase [Chryseobacterium angstadtii]|uniref:Transposase n=1 Tax=Chryseobacterium angstadtii TaxID=558151 RepID=A0A0J7IFH9_9FLAO|nr:recombinase family protein [Chryseobacterium angstadtii]KMQ64779.1 transposase [Chryseobacterium angstadtii]
MYLNDIHIGKLIKTKVQEDSLHIDRICDYFDCIQSMIEEMYTQKSLDCDILMKWSKLLKYDFFRLYSTHLMLYASKAQKPKDKTSLPVFKKHLYTTEIIEFVLSLIDDNIKTKTQIIEEYKIPKTTLYRWINKYQTSK